MSQNLKAEVLKYLNELRELRIDFAAEGGLEQQELNLTAIDAIIKRVEEEMK